MHFLKLKRLAISLGVGTHVCNSAFGKLKAGQTALAVVPTSIPGINMLFHNHM